MVTKHSMLTVIVKPRFFIFFWFLFNSALSKLPRRKKADTVVWFWLYNDSYDRCSKL